MNEQDKSVGTFREDSAVDRDDPLQDSRICPLLLLCGGSEVLIISTGKISHDQMLTKVLVVSVVPDDKQSAEYIAELTVKVLCARVAEIHALRINHRTTLLRRRVVDHSCRSAGVPWKKESAYPHLDRWKIWYRTKAP